jgi:hypothetical protein
MTHVLQIIALLILDACIIMGCAIRRNAIQTMIVAIMINAHGITAQLESVSMTQYLFAADNLYAIQTTNAMTVIHAQMTFV